MRRQRLLIESRCVTGCPVSSDRRGVAAVETALVLPLLLLVVFGTITTSQLIYFRKAIVVATSEGVRVATQRATTTADVEIRIREVLDLQRITGATIQISPQNLESTRAGDRVDIDVTANFEGFGYGPLGDGVSFPVSVRASVLRE